MSVVATEAGERDEDSRRGDLVTAGGGIFYPLVVDCLGCWTPSSLEIIKTTARKTVILNGLFISRSVTKFVRGCGSLINAKLFVSRLSVEVTDSNFLFIRIYVYNADHSALTAYTFEDIRFVVERFELACKRFGLSINLKKTEVLPQSKPDSTLVSSPMMVYNQSLVYVDTFKYLESSLSTDATIDAKISRRIFKAGTAFGKLESRFQKRREIKL